MGDIGIQLGAPFGVFDRPIIFQSRATLVAIGSAQVILTATLRTMRSELATGHGNKRTAGPFDNLEIAHHEAIIKGD